LELPFEYICDLQKWKFLSNTAGCPSRAAIFYHFKRRTVHNMSLKYGFNNSAAQGRIKVGAIDAAALGPFLK